MSEAQTRITISLPGVYRAEIVARCDYPVHYWELHIVQGGPDARYVPAAIELSPLHVRDICGALRRAESRFAQLAQMTRDSDYIEPVFSSNRMSADIVASNGALRLRLSFQNRTRWVFFTYVPVDKIEELRSGFESAGGRGAAAIIDLRDAEGGCITADRDALIKHHAGIYDTIRWRVLKEGQGSLMPGGVEVNINSLGWINGLAEYDRASYEDAHSLSRDLAERGGPAAAALIDAGRVDLALPLDYSHLSNSLRRNARIWRTLAGDTRLRAPTTVSELTELYAELAGWHIDGACSVMDVALEQRKTASAPKEAARPDPARVITWVALALIALIALVAIGAGTDVLNILLYDPA